MARSFHRTMLISSFIVAVGSFLLDLGTALPQFADFFGIELYALPASERTFAILACVAVIAFSAGGLVVIQILRNNRQNRDVSHDGKQNWRGP
jgi:hypothetical protein